jgi:hypothetical protein
MQDLKFMQAAATASGQGFGTPGSGQHWRFQQQHHSSNSPTPQATPQLLAQGMVQGHMQRSSSAEHQQNYQRGSSPQIQQLPAMSLPGAARGQGEQQYGVDEGLQRKGSSEPVPDGRASDAQ